MLATFDFEDSAMVHMERGSFMWVSIKTFRFNALASDADLIGALIAHRQYRDHYAGQSPEEQAQDDLYGPYWLAAISQDSFEPVAVDAAKAVIQTWADDPEPQDGDAQGRLEAEVLPLLDVSTLLQLADLRATAEHQWGWVVGQGGFHEFVAIDRPARRLRLIVASDD